MHIAAHTVFGSIEAHEFYIGSFVQNVDGGFQVVVHAGGIGDQTHTLALEGGEVHIAEHFNAGLHLSRCAQGDSCGCKCGYNLFHFYSVVRIFLFLFSTVSGVDVGSHKSCHEPCTGVAGQYPPEEVDV